MDNATRFRPYEPDQLLLLPADLSPIYQSYDGSQGGQPP